MNNKKVAFILCYTDEKYLNECLFYISKLNVPVDMETDVITVSETDNIAAGYNAAMKSTDAKYKVYLQERTFLLNKNLIADMLFFFENMPNVGVIGTLGGINLEKDGFFKNRWNVGRIEYNYLEEKKDVELCNQKDFMLVDAVDGQLMITQVDIEWREDIFTQAEYYDIAQCMEFRNRGYDIIIPYQNRAWSAYDIRYSELAESEEEREKFCGQYSGYEYNRKTKKSVEQEQEEVIRKSYEIVKNDWTYSNATKYQETIDNALQFSYAKNRTLFPLLKIFIDIKRDEERLGVECFWKNEDSFGSLIEKYDEIRFHCQRVEYGYDEVELINMIIAKQITFQMFLHVMIHSVYKVSEVLFDVCRGLKEKNKEEVIREVLPKPAMNIKWYKGSDLYSDGDIENLILKMILKHDPEDYSEILAKHPSWASYYHLSHNRKNLLRWYPFDKSDSVLEIGCGMGAITDLLCEKCGKVTSIELSKRRATTTWYRNRKNENLEIIVGNLNDIEFEEEFDYITLIGVLEYQGTYTDSENPYREFLKKVHKLLKPNGKLLIAIENKYGLKYWCGAREDHTGIPFDGINQYKIGNRAAETFSKEELKNLINDSGFNNVYFYYPLPDYKLPIAIYSEKFLPKTGNMGTVKPYFSTGTKGIIANETEIYDDLIKNNVFEFFANSFLVECSDFDDGEKMVFALCNGERLKKYRKYTCIDNNDNVHYCAMHNSGKKHIQDMQENIIELQKNGINVLASEIKGADLIAKKMDCKSLEDLILEAYRKRDLNSIYQYFDWIMDEIERSSPHIPYEESIYYKKHKENVYGTILKKAYVDMIARNCFCNKEERLWFDQEWVMEEVPSKFVLFRNIVGLYKLYDLEGVTPMKALLKHYEMENLVQDFQELQVKFYGGVLDWKHCNVTSGFQTIEEDVYVKNIMKMMK